MVRDNLAAGCGIQLHIDYFELDHITPKSDRGVDTIDNRIMLCAPCNRLKRDTNTIAGLRKRLQSGTRAWNEDLAKQAYKKGKDMAEEARSSLHQVRRKLERLKSTDA